MYADKLPPHNIEAEEAVIASLLIDEQAISKVAPFLKPDDFYREKNRWCYQICLGLFQQGSTINQVTLAHELGREGHLDEVGGQAYLSHLIANVPTAVHIEYYGKIVNQTSVMRQLINAASKIATIGYEDPEDTDSALNKAEDIIFQIRSGRAIRDFTHIREVLDDYLELSAATVGGDLQKSAASIRTAYPDLDNLLGGLQRSDLLILAARPGLGKSSLALNIAHNAASQGATVGIFSLEMSREQLGLRMLSSEASVEGHRLRLKLSGQFDLSSDEENRLVDAVGVLSGMPIYIDDSPLASISSIQSKARRLKTEQGLDLIIVDYLQLMRGSSNRPENRVQEVSEISRSLKGLARDLNVPVLAASQLSRAIEARPSHRPLLSDLRESGSIEQDADVVMFIYRDDAVYSEDEWEQRFPDRPYPRKQAEIIIAKHRNGPLDTINLYFRDDMARFESNPLDNSQE
jgi:replicative DNA helicase